MYGFNPKCAYCLADRKALTTWRFTGGEMPKKICPQDHRAICKRCKEPHEGRVSGLCDNCYSKHGKPRTTRFNPLDLVRGATAKRVLK